MRSYWIGFEHSPSLQASAKKGNHAMFKTMVLNLLLIGFTSFTELGGNGSRAGEASLCVVFGKLFGKSAEEKLFKGSVMDYFLCFCETEHLANSNNRLQRIEQNKIDLNWSHSRGL